MARSNDNSNWGGGDVKTKQPSPMALMACLEYLVIEAQEAGCTIAAHLIGAAADALREELQTEISPALSAENVVLFHPRARLRN